MGAPVLAIVGRPNVGKSTLFNRFVRERRALVTDMPGVTRDRIFGDSEWDGRPFRVVDTGGYESEQVGDLTEKVNAQIDIAIEEADCILFVLDGKEGLLPLDWEMAGKLRVSGKPVICVVNKIDIARHEGRLTEFYALGFEWLFSVSGEHGYRFGELLAAVADLLPQSAPTEEPPGAPRVAIIGRPNVGKSSLLNRLAGEERCIVSTVPGTTRDAIDLSVQRDGKLYIFIDTAGIRRKSRVTLPAEVFASIMARKSIRRCDVALLLLDALEGLTEQDARIGSYVEQEGRGLILLLNKWDQVSKDESTFDRSVAELRGELAFLNHAPVLSISALTGQRVLRVFPQIDLVLAEWSKRVDTNAVNRVLAEAISSYSPPRFRGRLVRIPYATQVSVRPPTFVFWANHPEGIPHSYHRYLERRLREAFGFAGTPLRFVFRKKGSTTANRPPGPK